MKISLDLMQSPQTSCSVKFTCFPGRHLNTVKLFDIPSDFQEFVDDVVDINVFSLTFHFFLSNNTKI